MKTEKEIETKAAIPSYLFSLPTGNERLRFRDSIIKLDFIILGNFCRGGNELIVFLFFFFKFIRRFTFKSDHLHFPRIS